MVRRKNLRQAGRSNRTVASYDGGSRCFETPQRSVTALSKREVGPELSSDDDELDKENVLTPQRQPRPLSENNIPAESSGEVFRAADMLSPSPGLQISSGNFGVVSPGRMTSTPNSTAALRCFPSPKLGFDEMSFSEQSSGSENVSECVSSIIESLPSMKSSPPCPQVQSGGILANTAPSDMLKGVRAFVEVRCGTEDISVGLMALLEKLGATVLKRMSHTVTHVVFRQGRRSTRKKALEWNIPMVSPLWVDNCRLQNKKVPEADYPAKIPPALDCPKLSTKFRVPKWCRPVTEGKTGTKRANKILTPKKMGSKKNKRGNTSPQSSPPPLAVPAVVTEASPPVTSTPLLPVSGNPVSKPESPKTPRGRRSLRTVLLKLRAEALKNDAGNCSTIAEQTTEEHPIEPSPILSEPMTAEPCVPKPTQNPTRRRQLFSQPTTDGQPPSLIMAHTPPPAEHVSSFFDDEELIPLRKRLAAETATRNDVATNEGDMPRVNYYMLRMGIDESPDKVEEPVTDDTSPQSASCRKRKRKRTNSGEALQQKKKLSAGNDVTAPQNVDFNGSKKQSSLEDFQVGVHKRRDLKPLSWLNSSAEDSKQDAPSLVLTSVQTSDEEVLKGVVQALGRFRVDAEVSQSTTHVICGEKKRTLNMLFAMAQGCWVLSPKWAYESLESGKWLPEEPYEVAEYFPAVKLSRLQRSTSLQQCLFSDLGFIYVSLSSSPPCNKLRLLVESAGGKVAQSYLRCQIAVGPVPPAKKFGAVTHVSEKWILDSISEHQTLPLEDYYA
ncbi:microcephalin-like isoform X2 [Ornithodoros turicata]|uniref:microcephalin-like isoform X2 n=1 Tax=Ornithodoros turicata TaxID=34597 RepID=UPI003139F7C5